MRDIFGSIAGGIPYKDAISDGKIGCCCDPCPPDRATITLVDSMITACTSGECVSINNFPFLTSRFTSVPILPTVNIPNAGAGFWQILGTADEVTADEFGSIDCSGMSTPKTDTLVYFVNCNESDWSVVISTTGNQTAIFYADGTGALPKGIPISNQITACNQSGFSSGNSAGFGGTVTLTW